jgi:hypothetical protein
VRLRLAAVVVIALGLLLATAASGQSPPSPPTFDRGAPDESITDGSAQRKLDRARRRWRRAGIHNYRFELNLLCFCPTRGPVVVFVRNDRPVNAPAALRDVATVRRLHRAVQRAIDRKVPGLSFRADRRGVPREIGIDNIKQAIDDEVAYRVDHFWRGTKGRGGPDAPGLAPR